MAPSKLYAYFCVCNRLNMLSVHWTANIYLLIFFINLIRQIILVSRVSSPLAEHTFARNRSSERTHSSSSPC
jgi:hypothetical protein